MTTKTNNCGTRRLGLRGGSMAVAVFAAAGLFAGCGGGGGGGGGGACADGQIQTAWDFVPGAGCLPGDQVVVRVDDNTMLQTLPCTAGGGITPAVEGGVTHTVDLTLFDGTDTLIEQSPQVSIFVPCGSVAPTPTYDFSS